jgi:hypothetical protein
LAVGRADHLAQTLFHGPLLDYDAAFAADPFAPAGGVDMDTGLQSGPKEDLSVVDLNFALVGQECDFILMLIHRFYSSNSKRVDVGVDLPFSNRNIRYVDAK